MDQDQIDTAPVIMKEDTHVEFASALVLPRCRSVIRLPVTETMRSPSLFASADPRENDVVLEELACEDTLLETIETPVESLRFGHKVSATLAEGVVLTARVRNDSDQEVRVGVSLVSAELVDKG